MSQKPTKWGIKVYSIADGLNGHLLSGTVYMGSETFASRTRYAHLAKTSQIVMTLMNPYLGKGYHLYTNRFYTSVQLAQELDRQGTINNLRKDLPAAIRGTKKNKLSLPVGGCQVFRNDRMMVCAWRPKKKNICMLSTGQWSHSKINRYSKEWKGNDNKAESCSPIQSIHEWCRFFRSTMCLLQFQ